MSTVNNYEIMKDGEWEMVSEEVWETHTGRRKMNIRGYSFGVVEYHGPCYEESGKVSTAVRECRCGSCTLFEENRRKALSPNVRNAVEMMLS